MELSTIGKELFDLLYKKGEKGEKGETHPLERYVIAFDESLDDDSLLRVIGERIGIFIDDEEDAAVTLFLRLKEYLEKEESFERTQKVIDMSIEEFSKTHNPDFYWDRLFVF